MFVQEMKKKKKCVMGLEKGFQQHDDVVTFTLIGAVSDLEDLNGDGTLSNYTERERKKKKPATI